MTIQPRYKRFDPAMVVADAIRPFSTGSVVLVRDADYRPDELMTVVQVPTFEAAGELPSNRWAFRTRVVLVTTGNSVDEVLGELEALCDGLLSQSEESGVLIHTVGVDSEPVLTSPHNPSGAESASASFSLILRRKDHQNG